MPDIDRDQERTEQASPRRREEARKKGQVARSQEVVSVAILLACATLLYFSSTWMLDRMMDLMRWAFRESGSTVIHINTVQSIAVIWLYKLFIVLTPLFLTIVAAGLLANYLQFGFLFSTEAVQFDLSKLDPIRGFQRLLSLKSLVELIKSLIKFTVVSCVVYFTMKNEIEGLIPLMDESVWGILVYIGRIMFRIVITTSWVLIVLAILDYLYQRWEFEKGLKMSKQEVKDEFKQTEGDPLVKARIKRIQREQARKRMMAKVPKADVVITNPVHLAVALEYDGGRMIAPRVVAKGAGVIAENIKEIALEHGVPVVENKPVAQLLYKIVNIDEFIPENLYRAVAEILAYVYSLKEKKV
ncbi:MAG TPA: flagellar biosynthesis protein FlhB [Syntrophales bacterium]|nr:flagellar biosynthesis protein FlhB [Syntrophales bacterium]HOX93430.1 flagellar biosynthesis protein FlhB [Syntrophales bacterium]HPI56649.1 flagellar biosynthesis protein FlhB [Syntrophales bacterium]HPN24925.1 flagellar biosynthesis protein FlhB [Syntrophales bacterium]HQM29734.1 flagellar biosynthesis protein FlhB [Syntrophales bacterium]